MKRFPTGEYGRQRLEFFPAPHRAQLRAFATLVFPWIGDRVVVCDIVGRGWCIPSGRVEAAESSIEAAQREALEEAGVELGCVQYVGCYRITERTEVRWADCYTARVKRLAEIAMPEESLGRKVVPLAELPSIYHLWNELTERVFLHAYEVLVRTESVSPPAKRPR